MVDRFVFTHIYVLANSLASLLSNMFPPKLINWYIYIYIFLFWFYCNRRRETLHLFTELQSFWSILSWKMEISLNRYHSVFGCYYILCIVQQGKIKKGCSDSRLAWIFESLVFNYNILPSHILFSFVLLTGTDGGLQY